VKNSFKKYYKLFDKVQQRRLIGLVVLTAFMALVEMAGVASVLPFLAVLSDPGIVDKSDFLSKFRDWIYEYGIVEGPIFLALLGAFSFIFMLFSAIVKSITYWKLNSFIEIQRHTLSQRLVCNYLAQNYYFFLSKDNSELSKKILSEVDLVVQNVFRAVFNMIAYTLVVTFILIFLLFYNPLIALISITVISSLYALVFLIVKKFLVNLGNEMTRANSRRFALINEAFTNIKFLKVSGQESTFSELFSKQSYQYAKAQGIFHTIVQIPNYFIELVALGSLLVLCIFLLLESSGQPGDALGDILPVVGVYALAAYRIKPAIHFIYSGFAGLRFGMTSLDALTADLQQTGVKDTVNEPVTEFRPVSKNLEFCNVSFNYLNRKESPLGPMNFVIPSGAFVGVIGQTGSGKSTLLDLVIGVLSPTKGHIKFGKVEINSSNLRQYQKNVAYVPQEVLLGNVTIAANIAFGLSNSDINMEKVKRVSCLAEVHDFVQNKFSKQYNTIVGERGFKLSGGERQRIGIARALYNDSSILVFDEATSALDDKTEATVISNVLSTFKEQIVIMAAHRESTLKQCDLILFLHQGRVTIFDSYKEFKDRRIVR
jgi:ABC-type multidrug transport system fused ATPase/permease subunit